MGSVGAGTSGPPLMAAAVAIQVLQGSAEHRIGVQSIMETHTASHSHESAQYTLSLTHPTTHQVSARKQDLRGQSLHV